MRVCTAVCSSLLALLTLSNSAQATIIEDLIGDVAFAPVTVDLDTPDGALNVNGVVHVVGQHEGIAARQLIDLTTGTVGQVEFFDSLLSAQGNGGGRDGRIRGVALTPDGVLYVGDSRGDADVEQVTYWFSPNLPEGGRGATGAQDGGFYLSVSQGGVFVGTDDVPLYGTPGNLPQRLPGLNTVVAADISANSEFIVGDLIWVANDLGGYDVLDTSSFDFAPVGETPTWVGVAIDPIVGDAVFAGTYFDLNTFAESVGFWRTDGSFIGNSGANTFFRDFEVWEGQLVAAVAGLEDSTLIAISDFSMIALESILGVKSLIFDDGLFVGSAGFLSNGASGAFLTTRVTNDPNGGSAEVPEPASCLLVGSGLLFGMKKRRTS